MVGAAVFANQIGLDHNASWGKGRIMFLLFGISIALVSMLPIASERLRLFFAARCAFLRTISTYLALVVCGILVILVYIWFISVGRWTYWPPTTNYYDRLATAFREGHLYLDVKFDPVLLTLPDPYDPDARKNIQGLDIGFLTTSDMTLYNGKVYIYWGPAPAVLIAMIKMLYSGEIGDQVLTFGFVSGLFLLQFLFLLRIWRRFFVGLSVWIVILVLPLVALINPIPWILKIPRIYEAAIASDQFFFIGGLYFAFSGLDRSPYSIWRFVLAGTFLAFAVGSRVTMALPIVFIVLMIALRVWNKPPAEIVASKRLRALVGLILPMLGGAFGLGWYNFARFGSVFEFGFRYALTVLNQNKFYNILFSPVYIFPNLYLYLLNPPSFASVFPFIRPVWNGEFISSFNNYHHTIYNTEQITGMVYSTPFSLFALSAAAIWAFGFARRISRNRSDPGIAGKDDGLFEWLLVSLLGAFALEFLTVLLIFYGSMRYFIDVTPTLVLFGTLSFWQGYRLLDRRPVWRGWYVALGAMLIVVSVAVSILLAFSSDVGRMRSNNPAMLPHLRLFFIHLLNILKR
jgi:hypothetical protein